MKKRIEIALGFNSAVIPEKFLKFQISKKVKPVILDIGCNVGEFSKLIFKIAPNSRIYAFDIQDELANHLQSEFKDFDFNFFNIGFSDINSNADLSRKQVGDRKAFAKMNKNGPIKLRTMDSFFARMNINKIDIIKIDTEGDDLRVIKGASKILKITDVVIFEIMYRTLINGFLPRDIIIELRKSGFKYFYRTSPVLGWISIDEIKNWEVETQNIIGSKHEIKKSFVMNLLMEYDFFS